MASERELERLLIRMVGENEQYKRMLADSERATRRTQRVVDATNASHIRYNRTLAGGFRLTSRLGLAAGVAAGGFTALAGAATYAFSAIRKGMEIETAEIQFGVMLGGREKGLKMLEDLENLALKSPVLELKGLRESTAMLLQFGFQGEEVIPTLEAMGNVTGGATDRMRRMALALAQMRGAGRLMGQDLLQMINAGFNPLQEISRTSGKSMMELRKEMEKGAVTADMVMEAFRTATQEGGRFAGMTDARAKSLSGLISQLMESVDIQMGKVGRRLIDSLGLKDMARMVIDASNEFNARLTRVLPRIENFVQRTRQLSSDFWEWFRPVFLSMQGFFESLVDLGSRAMNNLWDIIKSVGGRIQDSVGVTWGEIQKEIVEVFILGEFAMTNFHQVMDANFTNIAAIAVRTFNEIVHFLTEVIPAAADHLVKHWKEILTALFFMWQRSFTAMFNLAKEMVTNLPDLLTGDKALMDVWKPVFDQWQKDMKTGMKAIPKFTPPMRKIGDREMKLLDEAVEKGKKLLRDFDEFRRKRLAEIFGKPDAPPPPPVEEAGKQVGKAIGKGVQEGSMKAVKEVDHVLRRSAEAARRIQAQRDLFRDQARDARVQDKQKELVDVNKQQLGVLGGIKAGIDRLNPIGIANI